MKIVRTVYVVALVLLLAGAGNQIFAQNKAAEKTVIFEVSMHCTSCKTKIERDLAFEKGVKEVKADLERKIVTVKYVDGKITEDKLADAIKKLGYDVKVLSGEKKNESPIK